jgi:hypothetical protein
MHEIKYSADDKAFPQLQNSNDTKLTAAETQGGMTTEVSTISNSIIHSAVKDAFDKLLSQTTKRWNDSGTSNSKPLRPI